MRVSANDGFLTAFAQSEVFSVTNKPPVAVILSTDLNRFYVGDQTILLEGAGYDVEDGEVSDLTWYSDRDGVLGTGPVLELTADQLSEGTHVIRLEAKDSQGQSSFSDITVEAPSDGGVDDSQDTVTFDIAYDPLILPAELAVTSNLSFFTVEGANEVLTNTIEVNNLGDGEISWTASTDRASVTLSHSSGDAPDSVAVSVDTTGLTYGLHEGTIVFTPTQLSPEPPLTVNYFINVAAASTVTPTLILSKAGNGSGAVTSSPAGIDCGDACVVSFGPGTLVTLTATPAANSTFTGWSGACSGNTTTCQVTMNADRVITANFTALQSSASQNIYLPAVRR